MGVVGGGVATSTMTLLPTTTLFLATIVRVSCPLLAMCTDGFGAAIPAIASPTRVAGRSAISYADMATFEASIALALRMGSRPVVVNWEAVPVPVSNLLLLHLDADIVDEVNTFADDFSATAAICRFRGFWPSLAELHAWISKVWEPLILDLV